MKNALPPFTFSKGEAPVFQGGMQVMIVNPASQNKALAEEFIAQISRKEYSLMHWYLLHTDAVEPYDQKPYHITAEDIAAWQNTLSAVSFPIHSVLLTPSFTEQLTPLISRFAAGQMDVKTLLQKLNDTARMVEYELQ